MAGALRVRGLEVKLCWAGRASHNFKQVLCTLLKSCAIEAQRINQLLNSFTSLTCFFLNKRIRKDDMGVEQVLGYICIKTMPHSISL